jgi:hypothetical protein
MLEMVVLEGVPALGRLPRLELAVEAGAVRVVVESAPQP